jgi:hypothetical protein
MIRAKDKWKFLATIQRRKLKEQKMKLFQETITYMLDWIATDGRLRVFHLLQDYLIVKEITLIVCQYSQTDIRCAPCNTLRPVDWTHWNSFVVCSRCLPYLKSNFVLFSDDPIFDWLRQNSIPFQKKNLKLYEYRSVKRTTCTIELEDLV